MHVRQIMSCFALALLLPASSVWASPPAEQQVAVADSIQAVSADSLSVQLPDSLRHALPDSLAGATWDSLASSVADSVPGSESSQPGESWSDPWQPAPPSVDRTVLEWTRPEDFESAFDWLAGSSVRVAGETGMDAFVSSGPISLAPELLVDGVPSRSPADLDPAIFDQGSVMVTGVGSSNQSSDRSWGGDAVYATLDSPLAGRTAMYTYFTRTANKTFTRAIGLRSPGTKRMLRFEFQEFKTEEGYDYSLSPGVTDDPANRGRSKQRHFRIGGKALTSLGELGFEFGRGRRYTRGDALSADPHERWSGQLSLSLDRQSSTGSWHGRLYHLDFNDDWQDRSGLSRQSIDAARVGLRVEHVASDAGLFGGFNIEQQSARFAPPAAAASDASRRGAWVGQAGLGWRGSDTADWTPWVSAQALLADHTRAVADFGGRAGLRRSWSAVAVQAQLERIPRTPTLIETYGVYERRLVTPVAGGGWIYEPNQPAWLFSGAGELEFERQDRAELRLSGSRAGLQWHAAWSTWWLSRGIGWEPTGTRTASVVSGLQTDLHMVEAGLSYTWLIGELRLRLLGRGHYLPQGLEQSGGRPGGFPRAAARARIGIDRHFFSHRNRIGLDVSAQFMGEHFDDLTAPIGGIVSSFTTLDARVWLAIRDAELFAAVDNALDTERMEVLGTWRRFRQYRFGLTWNFYN
ncbi:hypothetical protein DRQ53_09000 [bacterium]|nr:MAG: hypothetical protein DRQ53_09000 [bacterium]